MATFDVPLWQERFAQYIRVRQWSAGTVGTYSQALKLFLKFLDSQGIESLSEVTRETLEGYRAHVFCKRSKVGKPWSAATQKVHLGAVKAFFRFLCRSGYLLMDLAAAMDMPKVCRSLPELLTEAETVQLLAVPDVQTLVGIRDRALLEVLYGTGLRNSELCDLAVDHIDLAAEPPILRVIQGKGNKSRVVPLGEEALAWLETYLVQVRPRWLFRSSIPNVFLGTTGRPMNRSLLTEIVSRLGRKAKLGKRVTPHLLRHGCATHMLARGAGLRHLQKLLGHSSSSTTEHYTQVEVSDLAKVLRKHHPRERLYKR